MVCVNVCGAQGEGRETVRKALAIPGVGLHTCVALRAPATRLATRSQRPCAPTGTAHQLCCCWGDQLVS
jgi:hypothetical protein